jgi:hypothetical protein
MRQQAAMYSLMDFLQFLGLELLTSQLMTTVTTATRTITS